MSGLVFVFSPPSSTCGQYSRNDNYASSWTLNGIVVSVGRSCLQWLLWPRIKCRTNVSLERSRSVCGFFVCESDLGTNLQENQWQVPLQLGSDGRHNKIDSSVQLQKGARNDLQGDLEGDRNSVIISCCFFYSKGDKKANKRQPNNLLYVQIKQSDPGEPV